MCGVFNALLLHGVFMVLIIHHQVKSNVVEFKELMLLSNLNVCI